MLRQIVGSVLVVFLMVGLASAQMANRGGFGNTNFGGNGLGNAGGFSTGPGFSNGSTNSQNFGAAGLRLNAYNYGSAATGMQGIPGVSNYGGSMQNSFGLGNGLPAVGSGMNNMGMNGIVPGIAPPGFTKDMFGYDVGIGSDESGYTDFGNAVTSSALGLGYGGFGYGAMGGPMPFTPLGFSYPGMVPGSFIPGVGYVSPADFAAANAMNTQANVGQDQLPPRNIKTTPGATIDANAESANANNNNNNNNNNTGAKTRAGFRRSFLNDNVPMATANAIRIQNRLHNVRSPNLKNIKVLIANRTAMLSGTVDSAEDEKLAIRMVGLEPGVVDVKSELSINGAPAK